MAGTAAAFLGIDVGTTAVKAVLVGTDGGVLCEAEVEQDVIVPRPTWSEQHPETWWQSTKVAVRGVMDAARSLPRPLEVRAIGLSGQMHSSVFLDANRHVIRPALLWNDARTTSQCREMTDRLGHDGLRSTVGNLALEGFTAPKVLWLMQNEPENYARLRVLLLAKDYVRYRLTGELATEPSDASGTILYDVRERRWSQRATEALEIPSDILPAVVESAEASGLVSKIIADELGIPIGTPVVGGGADNAAGAVGSGVVRAGRLQSSIGTSGTMLTPTDEPHVEDEMRLHTFCHCVPDRWYLMGTILSAGNSLKWLRDTLGGQESYDSLVTEAESVAVGADGLVFLPYMTGERTPHNDSNARGVLIGLHLRHRRGHLTRAVLEGVCFALRDSLELMQTLGVAVEAVRTIGGGARSRVWRQIQADVFNLPVATVRPAGGPAYGAALLAAVGAGHFGSVQDAVDAWSREDEFVEPIPNRVRVYDELYAAYRALYPSLKERFADMASLTQKLSGSQP